ncbi:hypothetical protein [Flavobacterium cheongpyeongense]|uniref:hypothetical protein n=1 Tax=Flavobacterium cheongpyeongense TaxID=2212651 RepID=UPI000F510430|nr:hypothetical protein [Flavobacterium cheongpyeongense]
MLTSCSNDDNSDIVLFPKQIVTTDIYNGIIQKRTTTITYLGDKIVKAVSDNGFVESYTYTDNLITKDEFTNTNGVKILTTYLYDSARKLTEVNISRTSSEDVVTKSKVTFDHNIDGTITRNGFSKSVLTYANGNLIKVVTILGAGSGGVFIDEYDNKKSPFSSVLGVNKLLDANLTLCAAVNNRTKRESYYVDIQYGHIISEVPINTITTINYLNKYNSDNYLTEQYYEYDSIDGKASCKIEFVY